MHSRAVVSLLALVVLLAVPSSALADGPTLIATPIPGTEIDVAGSGFPVGGTVLLVIVRNGAPDGSQTLTADSAGSFATTIDAGPGHGGAYTLIATSGTSKAVVDVVAVETAGGGTLGDTRPTVPPTDTQASSRPSPRVPGAPVGPAISVALLLVALLFVLRASARRERAPSTPTPSARSVED